MSIPTKLSRVHRQVVDAMNASGIRGQASVEKNRETGAYRVLIELDCVYDAPLIVHIPRKIRGYNIDRAFHFDANCPCHHPAATTTKREGASSDDGSD